MATRTPLRPKRLPSRTCVGCGTVTAKRGLIRIVRTPAGEVLPDPTGKASGRGAYLCPERDCWEAALRKKKLERALKTALSVADIERLRSFAERLGLEAGGAL